MTFDVTNNDRAYWALKAVQEFMRQTGTDREDAVVDLICDLLHLARSDGDDPRAVINNALSLFDAEEEQEAELEANPEGK